MPTASKRLRAAPSRTPSHRGGKAPRTYRAHHVAAAAVVTALATYGAHGGFTPAPAVTHAALIATPTVAQPMCDPSIQDHVYHAYRLQVQNPCVEVSGTVDSIRAEQDGDDHLQINLDQPYAGMVNAANQQYQGGDLVAEIICAHQATSPPAIQSCMGYTNQIREPAVGEHVAVTGPYVLDNDHHGWAEIHAIDFLRVAR